MTIGKRIKALREKHGMRQSDLANIVGVSDKAVSTWENDSYIPRMGPIQKMADYFHVSVSYIIDGNTSLPANLLPVKKVRVPLLGNVAAGAPILADQEYDTYVEANEDIRCDFALRVDGDSMEPTIRYGDLVFIRQQNDVDDGEIAAVLVDDSATLKHVYHIKDGLQLISDNPRYRPMICTMPEYDTIRILGKAVAFKRIL